MKMDKEKYLVLALILGLIALAASKRWSVRPALILVSGGIVQACWTNESAGLKGVIRCRVVSTFFGLGVSVILHLFYNKTNRKFAYTNIVFSSNQHHHYPKKGKSLWNEK
jgi:hypothetical protein